MKLDLLRNGSAVSDETDCNGTFTDVYLGNDPNVYR